jgi:hypothetical protein
MFTTVQTACRSAIRAHKREHRAHLIFKEMGLWRVKPVEDIQEIDQQVIYGWTIPSTKYFVRYGDSIYDQEVRERGEDSALVIKQFYKNHCYYSPNTYFEDLKLTNNYTRQQITECLLYGQGL